MKYFIIIAFFVTLSTARPNDNENADTSAEVEAFGARTTNSKSNIQAKRDISLSYAATNIDSKEGTRVKTITVIKNLGKKPEKLVINPELHKNEEWANAFRDNFESYGHIPDVPDIDDLFDFVNNKGKKVKEEKDKPTEAPKPVETPKIEPEKPVIEPSIEEEQEMEEEEEVEQAASKEPITTSSEATAEKIKGDAELLSVGRVENNSSQPQTQSQSLSINKSRLREPLVNVNYSTSQHAVHQYFDNYIQANPKGYNYAAPPLPPPCVNTPTNSISVSTTSGRTYDIPVAGGANGGPNPYLAPAISKKAQITPSNNPNPPAIPIQQYYPVNSILPPLLPNTVPAITATTRLPAAPVSTTQSPYVAPNLLQNGISPANRASSTIPPPPYRGGATNFRTNIFGQGANRPNTARSRGLKYYF